MKRILLFLFVFGFFGVYGQANIGFRVTGLGINPFNDVNKSLYTKNVFDDSGVFTWQPGMQLSAEFFGTKTTSIKFDAAYIKDEVGFPSGFSQITVNFRLAGDKNNTLQLGIGPVLHYRKSWDFLQNYQDETFYKLAGDTQFNVFWLSANIEYSIKMKKHKDFCVSLNHIHPHSIGILFGLKYWIKTKSNHCNTCPSYK